MLIHKQNPIIVSGKVHTHTHIVFRHYTYYTYKIKNSNNFKWNRAIC